MNDEKRLIEDYLPIKAISAEASREKSVRKGHISTLHLWWARRPLVACRAAVYGALVPASRFVPENGPDNRKQSLGRANAAKFVTDLCKYPGIPSVIEEAQRHILEAHAERLSEETGRSVTVEDIVEGRAPRPKVLDMFAGGGAIPLEALRLGCEAYALDLNPVAHIVELCTLVYPQKYGRPDPNARGMTGPKNAKGETTWGGLAEEVRYWGEWVLKKVKAEIGDLYPLIPDPAYKKKGRKKTAQSMLFDAESKDDVPPGYLMPVAYLWTRTVRCKNRKCGATVPLVKQTWLCKKKGRYVALKIVAPKRRQKGGRRVRFEVVEAATAKALGFDPAIGSRGGNATCPFCGTVADVDHVKAEGCAGRMSQQMMAVVGVRRGGKGKVYLPVDALPGFTPDASAMRSRIADCQDASGVTVPDEPMPSQGALGFRVQPYGFKTWGDMYSPRQALCLLTFASTIVQANEELSSLEGPEGRRKAVVTSLAAILDRLADFCSTGCTWNYTGGRGVLHTMARHALPMTWDFAETNPFNPDAASWVSGIQAVPSAIEALVPIGLAANVARSSAMKIPLESSSVLSEPSTYGGGPGEVLPTRSKV
ncbi:MAG: DUF1156 domain-containing protein [Planctomycetota bacterium]